MGAIVLDIMMPRGASFRSCESATAARGWMASKGPTPKRDLGVPQNHHKSPWEALTVVDGWLGQQNVRLLSPGDGHWGAIPADDRRRASYRRNDN
jgi:hypothetical protein